MVRRSAWWIFATLSTACLVQNPDFEASTASDGGSTPQGEPTLPTTSADETDTAATAGSGSDSDSATGSGATASTAAATDTTDTTDTTGTTDAATSAASATTAADQLCERIECGPHATCALIEGDATCVCDPGFIAQGDACLDVDECPTEPCDVGLCENLPGSYACAFPQTCAQLKDLAPAAPDGAYQLYVEGDAARPWLAWCHDMAGTPREYLTLPKQGVLENIATYRNSGTFRTTQYKKIRLDPATWRVDTADATFVDKIGAALYGVQAVATVAYGAGVACPSGLSGANVDLRNTPFAVTSQWCFGGASNSSSKMGSGQEISVTIGSFSCGWHAPDASGCPVAPIPINGVGPPLQLEYIGP